MTQPEKDAARARHTVGLCEFCGSRSHVREGVCQRCRRIVVHEARFDRHLHELQQTSARSHLPLPARGRRGV